MAAGRVVRRLSEYESLTFLELETRGPGTYIEEASIEGNSILSTVFVSSADPGASVLVDYFDVTTGAAEGEEYLLDSHPVLTSGPQDSRITVTRTHNKPRMRAVVTGGNVRFSVYITVVSSFASDLDAALQLEGEAVDFAKDQGMPIAALEATTNEWVFLRTLNGRLQVDVPGVLQVTQQTINFRRYNQTLALAPTTPTTHIDYTVPVGKKLYWNGGKGSADGWVKWTVDIDQGSGLVRWGTSRNAFDEPDVNLHPGSPLILTAGHRIMVQVENIGDFGNTTEVETWIFGALEDV